MPDPDACPLCGRASPAPHHAAAGTRFHRCAGCALIFRDPAQWPDRDAEAAHYRLHRNDPHDPGYRRFLQPLFDALAPRLPAGAEGLDFGCGPGPALAAMLREAGHRVQVYDPLFADAPDTLRRRYDFVTASEVIEHLHRPAETLALLGDLLGAGGILGVMTGAPPADPEAFARWHYLRDPTHVAFYGPDTLRWIAQRHGWTLSLPARHVALFTVPAPALA